MSSSVTRPSIPPRGPTDRAAILALQRDAGNQAVAALLAGGQGKQGVVVQRDPLKEVAKAIPKAPSPEGLALIRTYSYGWKKTRHTDWTTRLPIMADNETFWLKVRNHVMLGDLGDKGASGFHSVQQRGAAVLTQVGAHVGGRVYKSWVRDKDDPGFNDLKIST
ncbi:MAG: hypothetical protein ACRDJU_04075, partial [Actinomycetota bacterium]